MNENIKDNKEVLLITAADMDFEALKEKGFKVGDVCLLGGLRYRITAIREKGIYGVYVG